MPKWKQFVLPFLFAGIILFIALSAIFADIVASYSPTEISLSKKLLPPFGMKGGSLAHLMGTDELGRDILSRVIYGSRYSLAIAFLVIMIGGSIGTSLGLIAGFRGGRLDSLIMRVADGAIAFPFFLVALVLAALWGPGFQNVVISLVLTIWARYARIVRGEVLSLRERDFVAEARIIGCSTRTILTRHILPNVLPTLLVLITLQVGWAITLEAALSFLGAGIAPPAPAWGLMVANGKEYLIEAWWLSFFPGLAIMTLVLSFNLLGDWLRDHYDPRLREM